MKGWVSDRMWEEVPTPRVDEGSYDDEVGKDDGDRQRGYGCGLRDGLQCGDDLYLPSLSPHDTPPLLKRQLTINLCYITHR